MRDYEQEIKENSVTRVYARIYGKERAMKIIKALKYNYSVTYIDFSSNHIAEEGLEELIENIKYHPSLTSLNLHRNGISYIGGRKLLNLLNYNYTLEDINLTENYVSTRYYLNEGIINSIGEVLNRNKAGQRSKHQEIKQVAHIQSKELFDIPEEYCCPITSQIMMEPVIIDSGETYEREAIIKWLKQNNTDPRTNTQLRTKNFIENRSIKRSIVTFLDKHSYEKYSNLWDEVYVPKQMIKQLLKAIELEMESEIKRLINLAPNIMIKPLINDQTFLDLVIQIKNPDLLKSVIGRMGEQFWQHPLVIEENGASCLRRIASLGLINMSKIWGDALNWEREDYQIELREALKENNLEIVQVCISLGANVNKVSPEGEPPVFQAILSGNVNLLETLLQNGAFISRIDYKGETSLHKAVRSGNLEMVERILITEPELEL
ncbi:hypothetical protein NF27_IE00170, partial [Candidatus Jidaibacter acanthamoeba]